MIEIGYKVTVDYEIKPIYEERDRGGRKVYHRSLEKQPLKPIEVFVIGLRYRQEGWYHSQCFYRDHDGSEVADQAYLEQTKVIKCALVTEGLSNKEFLILWKDVEPVYPNW